MAYITSPDPDTNTTEGIITIGIMRREVITMHLEAGTMHLASITTIKRIGREWREGGTQDVPLSL